MNVDDFTTNSWRSASLSFEELDISLTKYQQLMFVPELKEERPALTEIHSQVLQNVVDRLDKAFQGFFRRCKAGEKPGFPRFRCMHRYNSFCYPINDDPPVYIRSRESYCIN